MVSSAIARSGATSSRSNVARLGAPVVSAFHFSASTPAVIEPPDTLEIRLRPASWPLSYKRQIAPMWNSMAR